MLSSRTGSLLFGERSASGLALRKSSPMSLGRPKMPLKASSWANVDVDVTRPAGVSDGIDVLGWLPVVAVFFACCSSLDIFGRLSGEAVTGLEATGFLVEESMEVMLADFEGPLVVIGRRAGLAFELGRESVL